MQPGKRNTDLWALGGFMEEAELVLGLRGSRFEGNYRIWCVAVVVRWLLQEEGLPLERVKERGPEWGLGKIILASVRNLGGPCLEETTWGWVRRYSWETPAESLYDLSEYLLRDLLGKLLSPPKGSEAERFSYLSSYTSRQLWVWALAAEVIC